MMNELYLAVTIDTECDKKPDWGVKQPLTFRGVIEAIPNVLSPLFSKHKAKPTYLLSPEVMFDKESIQLLRSLRGEYELGTHLHGRFLDSKRVFPERTDHMQCLYSHEEERKKLETITELFQKSFDMHPRSFRAGRFAASGRTITFLEELGYLVDSSVTPFMKWEGGLNFRDAPRNPYFPSYEKICQEGDSKVLEVPVTIGRRLLHPKYLDYLGPLRWWRRSRRVLKKVFGTIWLRPSWATSKEMLALIHNRVQKSGSEPVVFNMMFHNVEMIPNASPYSRNSSDVKKLLERIEAVVKKFRSLGGKFVTLSEVHQLFRNV